MEKFKKIVIAFGFFIGFQFDFLCSSDYVKLYPELAYGFELIGYNGHDDLHPDFQTFMNKEIGDRQKIYVSDLARFEGEAIAKAEEKILDGCKNPFLFYISESISSKRDIDADIQIPMREGELVWYPSISGSMVSYYKDPKSVELYEKAVFSYLHNCWNENFHTAVKSYLKDFRFEDSGRSFLKYAIDRHAHSSVVKLLIDAGADINEQDKWGETLLHTAAGCCDDVIVKLLIDGGANVHAQSKYGQTPLAIAQRRGLAKSARLLIDAGADFNMPGVDGGTVLHTMTRNNQYEHAKVLIDAGINVNLQDKNGLSALHHAAGLKLDGGRHQGDKVAKFLIEAGAVCNVQDHQGRTPLHIAVEKDVYKVIELLITARVDKNIRDQQGRTALDLACINEVREMLQGQQEHLG